MRRVLWTVLAVLLPISGGVAGYLSSPIMARLHRDVGLADRVARAARGERDTSDEYRAFVLSGETPQALYARARAVRRRFVVGGAIFGAWLGLVALMRLLAILRPPRRVEYVVDSSECLSCARCYKYCPRERLRWKEPSAGALPR